jgi:hypothetical protein
MDAKFIELPQDTESIYITSLDLLIFLDGRMYEVEKDWPLNGYNQGDVIKFDHTPEKPFDIVRWFFDHPKKKKVCLDHLKKMSDDLKKHIQLWMDEMSKLNKYVDWYQADRLDEKIIESRRQLNRYKANTQVIKGCKKGEGLQITRAKQVPITDFVKVNGMGFAKCPLHTERVGSFKYYENQNRWHCFSCGKGGDVIDLIRLMYNLTLPEAVKRLIGK